MKRTLTSLALLISFLQSHSQIKVMNLPVITTGFDRWNLIVDTLGPGGTKRMSIANFVTNFVPSPISGLTTNKIVKATGSTTIGNGVLSDDGSSIALPNSVYLTNSHTIGVTSPALFFDNGEVTLSTNLSTDKARLYLTQSQSRLDWNNAAGVSSVVLNASGASVNHTSDITINSGTKTIINTAIQLPFASAGAAKVLTSDASGNATWQTPASAGISGTTGYYPKFTSATAIGNSILSESGSNIILPTSKFITSTDVTKSMIDLSHTGTDGDITISTDGNSLSKPYIQVRNSADDFTLASSGSNYVISDPTEMALVHDTKVRINTAALQLDIPGAGAAKVLTSDGSGNATWEDPSFSGISGSTGGTLIATATNTQGEVAAVSAGSYFRSNGISAAPVWSTTKLLNAGTANYVKYWSSTNTEGESANLQFDGTNLGIGMTPVNPLDITKSQNATTSAVVKNTNTGSSAFTQWSASNGTYASTLGINSSGTSGGGVFGTPHLGYSISNSTVGYVIGGINATSYTAIYSGGSSTANERVRVLSSGEAVFGGTALIGSEVLSVQKNFVGSTIVQVTNNNGSNGANAQYYASNGTNACVLGVAGTGATGGGLFGQAGVGYLFCGVANGIGIGATNASGLIRFYTGGSASANERMRVDGSGNVGIGTTTISARLHAISTTEQLRIGYDVSNYYSTTVGSTGDVTFNAVGSGSAFTFSDKIIHSLPVNLKSYTVATLPAGTTGDMAYVTDATAPTYLGALTGGGAVVCPVFYNGSAWVSH